MSEFSIPAVTESDPTSWFHQRATAYVSTQILFHLNRVGVFQLLASREGCSVADMSRDLGLSTVILRTLLQYTAAVENLIFERAPDHYELTSFGKKCIERFGRQTGDQKHINFFDVRVGAYGPVWASLDQLLKGVPYGTGVCRNGEFAAEGVFKLAEKFLGSLESCIRKCEAQSVIEWGVNSGLMESLAQRMPHLLLGGVDRSAKEIERAQKSGPANARFAHSNVFETGSWTKDFEGGSHYLFFSLHLHEFLSSGEKAVQQMFAELRQKFSGSHMLFFEQPKLEADQRKEIFEVQWLYAQSNVLIHHLIGNGKILSEEKMRNLLSSEGCRLVDVQDTLYLGYKAFLVRL